MPVICPRRPGGSRDHRAVGEHAIEHRERGAVGAGEGLGTQVRLPSPQVLAGNISTTSWWVPVPRLVGTMGSRCRRLCRAPNPRGRRRPRHPGLPSPVVGAPPSTVPIMGRRIDDIEGSKSASSASGIPAGSTRTPGVRTPTPAAGQPTCDGRGVQRRTASAASTKTTSVRSQTDSRLITCLTAPVPRLPRRGAGALL